MREDTIAAVATAMGQGGIGIIRISGDESANILRKIFTTPKGVELLPRQLTYGHIRDGQGAVIDEVLAVYMPAPHTYTTEDVVEIDCHGSIVALRKVLALVLSEGARMAEPGEFTKRAFLGGRLDLSQAEAVMDLISARSDKAYDSALGQLGGRLSEAVSAARKSILDTLVEMTVNIDYPDEDIEELTYARLSQALSAIYDSLTELRKCADSGRIVREGLGITIVGRPNVGKSSLMNRLLGESRAIVTDIAGTTRDTIEEATNIRGIEVRLTDTAGIHETDDKIERIGIERSRKALNEADLIIMVIDGGEKLTSEDFEIMKALEPKKSLVLLNKSDIGCEVREEDISSTLKGVEIIRTSMENGEGLEEVGDFVEKMVYGGSVRQSESLTVTNIRHISLLEQAITAVSDARSITEKKEPLDIIEIDVRNAYDLLGEITGETASDDIINEVFRKFCLGK